MLTRAGSINAAGVVKDEPFLTASDKATLEWEETTVDYLWRENIPTGYS